MFEVFIFLSAAPLSAVVSDAMGVELFFLAQTASGSGAAGRFCAALPPSRLVTVNGSPGGVYWILGEGDIRFLFC